MLSIVFTSCQYNTEKYILHQAGANRKEIEKAIVFFRDEHKDSCKLNALLFLLENIATQKTELAVIKDSSNNSGKEINWSTLPPDSVLKAQLGANGLQLGIEEVPTIQHVKSDYLISTINMAFASRGKYSWNKNVTDTDFLTNVLPFNIYQNNPDDWRQCISKGIEKILDSLNDAGVSKPTNVYRALLSSPKYSQIKYSQQFLRFTNNPSYGEIMHAQKGECFNLACLYVYLMRTAGVPATIDIVPCWGTENGGHSEAVFLNETGKYAPDDINRFKRASKIYRYVVKSVPLRIDTSALDAESIRQIPAHLLNNHLVDVTSHYNHVIDITVKIPDSIKAELAFICVQNFSRWQAVEAAPINNGMVTFKKMNHDVFYQIAIPCPSSQLMFVNSPFILDNKGTFIYKEADFSIKQVLQLSQINSFEWNTVKKGTYYILQYLNGHSWKTLDEKKCLSDGLIIFDNVPLNAVYQLVENTEGRYHLSRCFTYENNRQVWW